MKFASIIAIAAALAFTAEAQGGNGDCDGQGGGKKRGRIPKRFWESTGTLLGCKATIEEAEEEGPVGGGFMHQIAGEATFVRTGWKDLDDWEGFDDADFDPRSFDVDVWDEAATGDCMDANSVHTAIGSFTARDNGKGRFKNPQFAGMTLNGMVGKYLGISVDGELVQCCQLKDLKAERDANDNDTQDD